MYERTFGTDWTALDRDEVLRRAFALGVAESLDQGSPDGEIDRLRAQATGRYGESLVDLAFEEGRAKAGRPHADRGAAEVWSELVESEPEAAEPFYRSAASDGPVRRTDLPSTVSSPPLLERTRESLERLRLPDFLR